MSRSQNLLILHWSYIVNPSSWFIWIACSYSSDRFFFMFLSQFHALFFLYFLQYFQTFSKLPLFVKFWVIAIVSSTFITTCHHLLGRKTVSPLFLHKFVFLDIWINYFGVEIYNMIKCFIVIYVCVISHSKSLSCFSINAWF